MSSLLAGLDESFFDAVPSPDPSLKRKTDPSPVKGLPCRKGSNGNDKSFISLADVSQTETYVASGVNSAESSMTECDVSALLEGAEDWNWDDMDDFLSPKKMKKVFDYINGRSMFLIVL